MHNEDDLTFVPQDFCGTARLFPLPNLVLFPHVVQPLHIFEPRYVEMLQDAINDDRLIAMSLLEPGWEGDYDGRPPVAPVACLGRVITCQEQDDSRYNLLLLGLERVRIIDELPPMRSFREARVDLLADQYPHPTAELRPSLHQELVERFQQMLPRIKDADELFDQLSVDSISLGTLTDVVAYALELDTCVKQTLLTEPCVDRRAKMLLSHLENGALARQANRRASEFPPAFSAN